MIETKLPEYLPFRCCMCPNLSAPDKTICPAAPILHPEESLCRFVKTYIDKRGWRYKVMGGLGGSDFKARYNKPGKIGWKCFTVLPWRNSFDEAQADLNTYAGKKVWKEG
jgi:hypothetical protein